MVYYIETSIILSLLLEDELYDRAMEIWNTTGEKVTSILTGIESLIVVRRYNKANQKKFGSKWLSIKEKKIKEFLLECNLLNIDDDIHKIIELKKEIADCRSLDAIHVATAIYFKDRIGASKISFYSFEKRVIEVAEKLGLRKFVEQI